MAVTSKARIFFRSYGYHHVPKEVPPHLLGPGRVWRKSYEVHPSSETVDVLRKYQFLTKTSVINGLPDVFDQHVRPEEGLVEDLTQRTVQYLAERSQHVVTGFFKKYEVTDGFLQSFLTAIWQLGTKYPHIVDSHFARNPRVETYWRVKGNNYICFPKPMGILFTSSPLQLFAESNDVTTETSGSTPLDSSNYQPWTMGMFQRSFDQIDVCGGCKRQGPYPFAHTIFTYDRSKNRPEQTQAHALMSMFAQATAQTVQNGFKLDQDLVFPLSVQAILTDGRRFSFACYQLNTLDCRYGEEETSSRQQNFLWVGPSINMYEYVSPNGEVVGLNKEAMKYVCQFLLNKPMRKRPPHSGFMLDTLRMIETEKRRKNKAKQQQSAAMSG